MNRDAVQRLERLWYPSASGEMRPSLALRCAAALYGLVARSRAALYDRGFFALRHLPVPCVSIGNLSVGGTGKTPLVAWLVEQFLAAGARPAVVSRGYGGNEHGPARVPADGGSTTAARFGDEPALLAARFPLVPVVVGRDRHAAGLCAVRIAGATVVIADDAFQHRRLARDLDIVVVDATRGMGNGRLLPAGPLREAPGALARAGAVVLNRIGGADVDDLRRLLADLAPLAVAAESDLVFEGWRPAQGGDPAELPPGAGVYAFCGIANPASFSRTLEEQGLRVLGWEAFTDHHPYAVRELEALARAADAAGAVAAVTTAKDAVRVPRWPGGVPLYRAEVKIAMIKGCEQLWEALKPLAARGG